MSAKKVNALSKQAGSVPALIQEAKQKIDGVEKQLAALKKAGLIYASEHWRKDAQGDAKYFYLLYPSKVGEKRRREYVGCDAESIAKARAGMERAKQFDALSVQLSRMQYRLDEVGGVLNRLVHLLNDN